MARLIVENENLEVKLSTLEKIGALFGGVSVPLSTVSAFHLTDKPYSELRGLRIGTAVPYVILLGRMLHSGNTDFVAIYGKGKRTAVVELAPGGPYKRIFVSGVEDHVIEQLRSRVGSIEGAQPVS
jgi:hypothetical protein